MSPNPASRIIPLAGRRPGDPIAVRAQRVAEVAARHAQAVDRDNRYPVEALDAAKAEGLLAAVVPEALGGEGASPSDIANVCYTLGQACGSAAMIFAMHQVKAACVINHSQDSAWHRDFMRKMARHQLLLASSTTEGSAGGDVRNSSAPVERNGPAITLNRAATVVSYGAQADAIVTTARRSPESAPSDQVLVVFEKAQYTLNPTVAWRTLGMRGTASTGFDLKAEGREEQIMPQPYAAIHSQSMTPTAHLFWTSAWAGIAANAVERARLYLRRSARGSEQLPSGMQHLHRAQSHLTALRGMIAMGLARYEAALGKPDALTAVDFQTAITLLKVDGSDLAVAAVTAALRACGLAGYREDGDASLGRHLRDVLSAPIMINNDRILGNLGASTLLVETPRTLGF